MTPSRLFYIVSSAITLFTKAVVVVHTLSDWKNSQGHLQSQRNRVLKQLTLVIITFRISRHMLKRSVVSFLILAIVVIKLLTVQVKLVKLARSLKPFNGPIRLVVCMMLSGAFLYLKLMVEVSWAVYYLILLCRNPSIKETCVSLLGLLRLLEWK